MYFGTTLYLMGELEFVIALTEHRFFGNIFQPLLIEKKERFFSVERHVKPHDFNSPVYEFKPYEIELIKLIERFSDERLMRKFSRAKSVTEFYSTIKPAILEKQITPFIEECMMKVVAILMLSPVRLFKKAAKYGNLYEEDIIEVAPFFGRPVYHFERTETETRYRLKIFLDSREILLSSNSCKIVTNNPCLLLYRNQLVAFEKLNAKKISVFFEKDYVVVPNTIEDKYYSGFILNTIRNYEVKATGFLIEEVSAAKTAVLSLEKNLQYHPGFVLGYKYGNEIFPLPKTRSTAIQLLREKGNFVFRKTVRNFEWEQSVISAINAMGLVEQNGYFTFSGVQDLTQKSAFYYFINWLNKNRPRLEEIGITVVQDKLEENYFTGLQEVELKMGAKNDWFDINIVIRFGEFAIPFLKLRKYIINGTREFVLPNGEIAVLPEEWFEKYTELFLFGKNRGKSVRLDRHHFMLLENAIDTNDKSLLGKLELLLNGNKKQVSVPEGIHAQLRTYQKVGFVWMNNLNRNRLGGCLADDMGLGKTLQTLAILLKLKRKKQPVRMPPQETSGGQLSLFDTKKSGVDDETQPASLIVVPTSLVHNWSNEIDKFTPALKVFKYVGMQRKKVSNLAQIAQYYDVILTTYGTVRNDSTILAKTEFYYLILDESQYIKNSASKTYKAIMELRGQHRLVITGTPIENSLSDLWSQMNFINPGILGNLSFFNRSFIVPIEKHANQKQQERLQFIIRPFILRRKKNEVAKELPPLVEQVVYCRLEDEQQKIYEKEKSIVRNAILTNVEGEGVGKSSIIILQGLAKLRQLACHPAMVDSEFEASSGKFDEIFRMLQNLVAENHKVLIFSSFVKHLELIQKKIEAENWKFSKLTGQTTKREKVIKEFQKDSENHIFLISLKAGGVGLNLTEADYVFIIDPWWNPAAENQAINRAHRIGQDKHVFVYRFITEESIEEKIQKLKERKSSLANLFINSNNPFKKITKEEIVQLFE